MVQRRFAGVELQGRLHYRGKSGLARGQLAIGLARAERLDTEMETVECAGGNQQRKQKQIRAARFGFSGHRTAADSYGARHGLNLRDSTLGQSVSEPLT